MEAADMEAVVTVQAVAAVTGAEVAVTEAAVVAVTATDTRPVVQGALRLV